MCGGPLRKTFFGTGKSGCPKCASKSRAKNRRYTQEEFEAVVAEKFPNIKILSKYEGFDKPVTYECSKCGQTWTVEQAVSLTYGRVLMHNDGECGTKMFPEMSDEAIREDFANGLKRKEIAEKYGCSIRTVANRLEKLGLRYNRCRK